MTLSSGATIPLITAIVTVTHSITLPPVGNALLGLALEHPLVAVTPGEVGAGHGGHRGLLYRGDVGAVLMLVAAVVTVRLPVTLPVAEHAVTISALELPVVTLALLVTILKREAIKLVTFHIFWKVLWSKEKFNLVAILKGT